MDFLVIPADWAARTCGFVAGGGERVAVGLEGASSRDGEARRAAREWMVDSDQFRMYVDLVVFKGYHVRRFLILAVLAIMRSSTF